MSNVLVIKDLYLRVGGRQIFSEMDLTANPGEVVAICGGAADNKNYLVNLLTRVYPDTYTCTGKLIVDNTEIENISDEEMHFFRLVNTAILPPAADAAALRMTVQQYITVPFRESIKKSLHEILTDAKRIMQLLGITDPERILHKRLRALHIKDLRAVLYAAALATDPAIAVFHDILPDISPAEAEDLYALLIKVCKIKNIALLFLTSDLQTAKRIGEKVYISKQDHMILLDDTMHAYETYLSDAAQMCPLPLPAPDDAAVLEAVHVVPDRGAKSLDFILHANEILSFPCQNGPAVFSGKRKPVSGILKKGGLPILHKKSFSQNVMILDANLPIPPLRTVKDITKGCMKQKNTKMDAAQIYTVLGLPADYGNLPTHAMSLYEKFRLGLTCAVAMEADIILIKDIEKLESRTDIYDILHLLIRSCEIAKAGALVFTGNLDILHALKSTLYKDAPRNPEPVSVGTGTEDNT